MQRRFQIRSVVKRSEQLVLVLGFVPRDWNTGAHATKPECENAEAS